MVFDFSNVAFSLFGFSVHWYSLAYILGIFIALKLTIFFARKSRSAISMPQLEDFLGAAVFGIIVGGRLGHVLFYDSGFFFAHPIEIFKIWKGGMSFYGGFLGILVVAYRFCVKRGINFLKFMDLWSIGVPQGLFWGRIANFINGELLGKESNVAWNVVFRDGIPRHPSQIYEALGEGALLFLIMLWSFKKRYYRRRGRLSGIFCLGYGAARFAAEIFREPDSMFSRLLLYHSGLNLNQYLSISMALLGISLIFKSSSRE
ncbi:MAG: prolipoprotein diacylglyceryl transferase [Holosporaceae bacterium]|jgi:phosphatidylglycerol:prolipoprotein diacylglycerol transferase|nr:prolipoprotein diacylglyceryl transferase [Holosporaceae bacterium]